MSDKDPILDKLSAARTRLILDKPFLGALVLRMPLIEADGRWCKTTATDAKNIYYNPDYIEHLNLSQTEFMLAHEALHCALTHFARRGRREKHRWDVACDYAINPILIAENLDAPPGTLLMDHFKGMTAEEIYPSIESQCDEDPLDDHVYDENNSDAKSDTQNSGGFGQQQTSKPTSTNEKPNQEKRAPKPPPLTENEKQDLSQQWQQHMAGAAQQAMQAGKLSGALARLIDHFLQTRLPWRQLLAKYMSAFARDDYRYARPNTRRGGPAIFPSLRGESLHLVIALDTSGSISNQQLQEFVTEVDAIKSQINARITLLACDAKLVEGSPWRFEPWDQFVIPKGLTGGGATDFRPIFDWVMKEYLNPDLLVYFTDGQGKFPTREPDYPVLWLIKGKSSVSWGDRIQLN